MFMAAIVARRRKDLLICGSLPGLSQWYLLYEVPLLECVRAAAAVPKLGSFLSARGALHKPEEILRPISVPLSNHPSFSIQILAESGLVFRGIIYPGFNQDGFSTLCAATATDTSVCGGEKHSSLPYHGILTGGRRIISGLAGDHYTPRLSYNRFSS